MKSNEKWIRKTGLGVLVACLIVSWNPAEITAQGDVGFSVGAQIGSPADFYSPLASYGTWVNVSQHGRCWRPAGLVTEWRPYTIGHWEWTDCGWYWVSDEPWAWACYHYGSWVLDPVYGWLWIPGTEWAPAWVVWRQAPDYVGWAPCGPGGVVLSDTTFAFVDVHHFHDHLGPRSLVFNDAAILGRSRPVGSFRRETRDFDGTQRRIAFNPGPGVGPIQHATGTRFSATPVRQLVKQTPIPNQLNRARVQPGMERPHLTQKPVPPQASHEQPRLYREAPQPAPTGRQEQRIYREAPAPGSAPRPQQLPAELPRRQAPPETPVPQSPAQRERPLPPPAIERGNRESREVPRREEPAPRVAPAQREAPAVTASPAPERERNPNEK